MVRWIAGIAAILLFATGAVFALQSHAEESNIPNAPLPRIAASSSRLSSIPNAPEADAKSKEQKRFERADKDEDGRITLAELAEPRRKAFAKLDLDHDGRLSFEEWAARSIKKFADADSNKDKILNSVEFASTAPKPRPKKPACSCS